MEADEQLGLADDGRRHGRQAIALELEVFVSALRFGGAGFFTAAGKCKGQGEKETLSNKLIHSGRAGLYRKELQGAIEEIHCKNPDGIISAFFAIFVVNVFAAFRYF
jgi:hypothetical protein